MKEGYYWYGVKKWAKNSLGQYVPTETLLWEICLVKNGYVHFFGQVSQEIGNEYLTKFVTFGAMIEPR